MRLIAISALSLLLAAPVTAQAAGDICPGLESVLGAAAKPGGLASLAQKAGPAGFAEARKPAGMDSARECSVVRGAAGGRDQFDCRWIWSGPDKASDSLSAKAKTCLVAKGWKADAPEKERGATISRFTSGALEVLTVEVSTNATNHADRLSVSAPVK